MLFYEKTSTKCFFNIRIKINLVSRWQEYYDKMSDEDKNMLPLKRIAFLGNNE
jgi:predicted Mrr-cat superfamily restriction endonuclease